MKRRVSPTTELAGRVECLEQRALLSAVPFAAHTIVDLNGGGNRADAAAAVVAADINGDGYVDVVSASFNDDKIAWYDNANGDGLTWTPRVVSNALDGPLSVFVSDLDGDGDLDIVAASWNDDTIAWFENDGNVRPEFTLHTIATNANGGRSVYAADIDGDGDIDVLSASLGDDKIAWYENTLGDASEFVTHVIALDADQAFSVFAADIDGDNDLDVVSASRGDDKIAWYENTAGDGSAFTAHVVSTTVDEANSVFAADLDGDGDMDLLAAAHAGNAVYWFENTAGDGSMFVAHTVSNSADGAFSVFAADVDGDNDLDVISASRADDEIAWYENTAGNASNFTYRRISSAADGAQSVFAADVDGDGDLDVLSASFNDDKIAWYENSPVQSGPAPVADIIDVAPDPRSGAVGSVSIVFTQPVSGVDVGDFRLTRSGGVVSLGVVTLTQVSSSQYLINLSNVTAAAGSYELRLVAAGSGIVNANGQSLAGDATDTWMTSIGQPVLTGPTGTTSDTTPTITWTSVAGADHYDLQVNNLTSGGIEVIRQPALSATSFTPVTPLPAGTYQAFVRAFDGSGQAGAWSPGLTFTVSLAPVADIVDVTPDPRSTPVGLVNVVFSEPVTGVDVSDFRLTRDGSLVGLAGVVLTPLSTSQYRLDLTAVSALPGSYELRLAASGSGIVDLDGTPLAGDAADAWETLASLPVLTGPAGTISDLTPTFTWNAVVDAVRYELRVNNVGTGDNDVIHELNLTGTSFTPASPLAPGTYQATLRSFDSSGTPGPWSAPLQFTIDSLPTADIVDVTPDPRSVAVGTVIIRFSEVVTGVDIGDFRLTRDASQVALTGLSVQAISGSEYHLDLSSRTGGTGTYELLLRAAGSGITDSSGDPLAADASDTWETVVPLPTLTGPVNNGSDTTPTFTWMPVVNVDHYELRVNSTSTGDSEVLRVDNLTTTSYTPASPLPAGSYQAWLRVFSAGGEAGPWSVPLDFVVEAATAADIVDVTPDPRTTNAGTVSVMFTRDVTGLDIGDFRLTRDGSHIALDTAVLVQVSGREYTIDLSGVTGPIGNYELRLVAAGSGILDSNSEPLAADAVETWQVVSNSPPVLSAMDDLDLSYRQDTHAIEFDASDANGDSLTYTVAIHQADRMGELAFQLNRDLGLFDYTGGHYWLNYFGLQEKWMEGTGRKYYYITPDGRLFHYGGSIESSTVVGTLDAAYHANPALLHEAAPPDTSVPGVGAAVSGNVLTLDPPDGFVGEFEVVVTVSDGAGSDQRSFFVRIANLAPVLEPIGDRSMSRQADVLEIDLSASDPDGDPVSYAVEVSQSGSTAQLAYELNGDLGLFDYTGGHYWFDYFGLREKWMEGTGRQYYYITPEGWLYHYQGSMSASRLIARLSPSYHADPATLHEAQPPAADDGSVSATLSGNRLTLDPAVGFVGAFDVTVEVTDGVHADRETFRVEVANLPPVLDVIADQAMAPEDDVLVLPLTASDPDGDALTFSADILLADPLAALAYDLDQRLGLFEYTGGHYWFNYYGIGEKWMEGANKQYYYITPDGSLYQFKESISSSVRVATLSSQYHSNPALLHDALPPDTALTDVTATVAGNVLTIDPSPGYTGVFLVNVSASDGEKSTTRTFFVQVNEAAAALAGIDDQLVSGADQSLVIELDPRYTSNPDFALQAEIAPADTLAQAALDLDRELGLFDYTGGHYWFNYFGLGEKWMEGLGRKYYYILPDGRVFHYKGSIAASSVVATLDASYHADPAALHEASAFAQAGSSSSATVTLTGNRVIVEPSDGFTGELRLTLSVTIGPQSASKTVRVLVGNVG